MTFFLTQIVKPSSRAGRLCQFVFLLLATCQAGGFLFADASQPPTREAGDNRSAAPLTARYTPAPVTIDGEMTEPAWTTTPKVLLAWQTTLDKQARPVSRPGAWVRLLWDDRFLYMAARCRDRDLIASLTRRDSKVWKEDALEFFLKPEDGDSPYFEFQWNPLGTILDGFWPRRKAGTLRDVARWNCEAVVAVRVDGTLNDRNDPDRGWQIEVRIPFADLRPIIARPPRAGESWRALVASYNFTLLPRWAKIKTSTAPCRFFHEYEVYSTLTFDKTGPPPAENALAPEDG